MSEDDDRKENHRKVIKKSCGGLLLWRYDGVLLAWFGVQSLSKWRGMLAMGDWARLMVFWSQYGSTSRPERTAYGRWIGCEMI
jgi:hypothetical protein